tara:strand:+ start:3640 stop:3942 length:303 start_codon:yes stop_codon:yes gene_type:complete
MSWKDILKEDLSQLKESLERLEDRTGDEYVDWSLELAEDIGLRTYLRKYIKSYQKLIKDLESIIAGVNSSEEPKRSNLLRKKNAFERHLYDLYQMQEKLQ